jgi:hypothetical protein
MKIGAPHFRKGAGPWACLASLGVFAALAACGTSSGSHLGEPGSDAAIVDGGSASHDHDGSHVSESAASDAGAMVVAEHALAQVGFAIALAASVLQTQLIVIGDGVAPVSVEEGGAPDASMCTPMQGGGSSQAGPSAVPQTYDIFYDSNCTQRYIGVVADALLDAGRTEDSSAFQFGETLSYDGLDGGSLGVLSLTQNLLGITLSDGGTLAFAYGTGTFAPTNGHVSVQLGLSCSIGDDIACSGGVAQDFPALSIALGSVTPLTLTMLDGGGVDFSGSGSSVVSGPLGSLELGTPDPPALAIAGGKPFTSTNTEGGAAAFSFFPPMPTGWTITDSAHDEEFEISVLDDTKRNLAATIKQTSTQATLAEATLDQSGTGKITYSDGSTAAVTSWTLED